MNIAGIQVTGMDIEEVMARLVAKNVEEQHVHAVNVNDAEPNVMEIN